MSDNYNKLYILEQMSDGNDWISSIEEENRSEAREFKSMTLPELTESIDSVYAHYEIHFRQLNGNLVLEKLTEEDPIEKWITDFISSDNPRFDGKSKEERIKMALGAYYGSKKKNESVSDKRDLKIMTLMVESTEENLVRYFIESNGMENSILEATEKFKLFIENLLNEEISLGSLGEVECIMRWGACKVGKKYSGSWKKSNTGLRLDLDAALPNATAHPNIFYNVTTKKLDIPKQFKLL